MSQTAQPVAGPLLHVLKYARRAWYQGPGGITAYYEQPAADVPGAFYVNGKRITGLMVDPEGLFWDRPSPTVQHIIGRYGVSLDEGWTCDVQIVGSDVESALAQSPWHIAQHPHSGVAIHQVNGAQSILFVNEQAQWSVPTMHLRLALNEMGASPYDGWLPSLGTATTSKLLPARMISPDQPVPPNCYGGPVIVAVEGSGNGEAAQPLRLRVSGGYTARMVQDIVPSLPGLKGWECHIDTPYGEIRTMKLFRESSSFIPPYSGALLSFSTAAGRFPEGIAINTVTQFLQIARYAGLAGRAYRIGVTERGYATDIMLLEVDWQKYAYAS